MKKAADQAAFFSSGRYISLPGPQKKARGPGRLRADGKIPSRGQFEGTGSVQVSLTSAANFLSASSASFQSSEPQAARYRSSWCPDQSMLLGWSG